MRRIEEHDAKRTGELQEAALVLEGGRLGLGDWRHMRPCLARSSRRPSALPGAVPAGLVVVARLAGSGLPGQLEKFAGVAAVEFPVPKLQRDGGLLWAFLCALLFIRYIVTTRVIIGFRSTFRAATSRFCSGRGFHQPDQSGVDR